MGSMVTSKHVGWYRSRYMREHKVLKHLENKNGRVDVKMQMAFNFYVVAVKAIGENEIQVDKLVTCGDGIT